MSKRTKLIASKTIRTAVLAPGIDIGGEDGSNIALVHFDGTEAECRANADFLVLAWNCHEELVEALVEAAMERTVFMGAFQAIASEIRRSHDAGDGHFSTEQVEVIEAAIRNAKLNSE
jgi:formate-dependent nitrite reductase cytochrome c552 subunit